jgi:hypothetical protein
MSIAFAEFETMPQSELFTPRKSATQATVLHCLIVAEDAERREFLTEAARVVGWEVAAYADAHAASIAAKHYRHALTMIDLDGLAPGTANGFRTLAEQLSAVTGALLMVCGTDGNALEEIWARQLGVWLYLSGIDTSCDVTSLFSEAKQVVQKLNRAA